MLPTDTKSILANSVFCEAPAGTSAKDLLAGLLDAAKDELIGANFADAMCKHPDGTVVAVLYVRPKAP